MNGWELVVLVAGALLESGPERKPEYSARPAAIDRQLKASADAATRQLRDRRGDAEEQTPA